MYFAFWRVDELLTGREGGGSGMQYARHGGNHRGFPAAAESLGRQSANMNMVCACHSHGLFSLYSLTCGEDNVKAPEADLLSYYVTQRRAS